MKQEQLIKTSKQFKMLLLGVYFPLLIFVELAIAVWQNGGSLAWDAPILLVIHQTAQTRLDGFAARLTELGNYEGVIPATAVIVIVLLGLRRQRQSIYLLSVILGCYILSPTAKLLLHRARPSLWESAYPLPSDYAFPSGHAMSSMTLAIALVVLSWNSPWRWLVLIVGSLFVIAIAWTRLYLGVHFPSDILAGWMLSIAWVIGMSLLFFSRKTEVFKEIKD